MARHISATVEMIAVMMVDAMLTAVLPAAHEMRVKASMAAENTSADMDAPQMRSGGPWRTISSSDCNADGY